MNMAPGYARAKRSERATAERPSAQGAHHTTVGLMGREGMVSDLTFAGYLDKDVFIGFLEEKVVPFLANTKKFLVMDNCSVHRAKAVIELPDNNKVNYCFLPPYTPEFNPIELVWSKLKNYVKKCKPRGADKLLESIREGISSITVNDAAGYFSHVDRFLYSLS